MAVYVATQAADVISKVVGVYFVLSAFVVLQFEHVVADMFTIPMCVDFMLICEAGTDIIIFLGV